MWTLETGYEDNVHNAWSDSSSSNLIASLERNLGRCAKDLTSWSRKHIRNNRKVIQVLTNKLRIVQSATPTADKNARQRLLQKKLEETWRKEEMIQRNAITMLKNEQGEWVDDVVNTLIKNHFTSIYTSVGVREFGDVLDVIDPIITEHMNTSLVDTIANYEIVHAVKQLCAYKAPSKDGFPEQVGHFRPISLCNFVNRIINKIMANRIKTFIHRLISPQQSDFIPSRLIQDSMVIANEAFHYIRHKNKGNQRLMALKLDLHKAFDRVEWVFIMATLKKMGFVDRCASGQNINFTKSSALFSPNSPEDLQQQLCNLLNVQRMDPKARYLGLPFVIRRNKNELFSIILDKVLHKMEGWKQKLLSQAGREILIKSVIKVIPSYAMQCYLLPKGYLDKLLTYIYRFFGMKMRMGSHPSWLWQSLLLGRDVLLQAAPFSQGGYRQALLLKEKDPIHASSSSSPTGCFNEIVLLHQFAPYVEQLQRPLNICCLNVNGQNPSVKLNCDASFKNPNVASCIVARSLVGSLITCFGKKWRCDSALAAELQAIRLACVFAANKGWFNAIIESDSQTAIMLATTENFPPWALLALVMDILYWQSVDHISRSLPSNTQPNLKGHNSKAYQPPQSRNEHVFTRSGKSYNSPVNLNDQQTNSETPINFDSDDEDEEPTPQPKTQNPKPVKETPLPKPYKPKIPYPQRLRKEKMEAQYGKFLNVICAVRINVPLIDVLARMPNYGKFLKELISNKHKIKQISATFLSDESSTMIQNKVPPKLGDPEVFLFHNDESFQYPVGIAENMLVEVGKFTFPADFVILEMKEDSKVSPLFWTTLTSSQAADSSISS
ncbi:reverse transcriptase domain-containing protein [Tanacetum coccineum]